MPRSTFLWVVHEYWFMPVAPCTQDFLWDNFLWVSVNTECWAPVSMWKFTGVPSTLRVTLGSGRGSKLRLLQSLTSPNSRTCTSFRVLSCLACTSGQSLLQWPTFLQYVHWSLSNFGRPFRYLLPDSADRCCRISFIEWLGWGCWENLSTYCSSKADLLVHFWTFSVVVNFFCHHQKLQ